MCTSSILVNSFVFGIVVYEKCFFPKNIKAVDKTCTRKKYFIFKFIIHIVMTFYLFIYFLSQSTQEKEKTMRTKYVNDIRKAFSDTLRTHRKYIPFCNVYLTKGNKLNVLHVKVFSYNCSKKQISNSTSFFPYLQYQKFSC